MLIVDLPCQNTSSGAIRIGVIGSCRVRDMLFNAYPSEAEKACKKRGSVCTTIWSKFSAFTHTTLQAKQHLEIFSGLKDVPEDLQPMIFNRHLSSQDLSALEVVRSELFSTVDMFVVEVATLKSFESDGYYFNQNYLERNFVKAGGKPMLEWLRSLTQSLETHEQLSRKLLAQMPLGKLPSSEILNSLLINARMRPMDSLEFNESLGAIEAYVDRPVMFVPPITLKESPIADKIEISRRLKDLQAQHGYQVYDATSLVEAVGREIALAGDGADLNHFAVGFHHQLVKAFAPVARQFYNDYVASKMLKVS